MKVFRGADAPAGPGDPKTFTGPVRTARLAADDAATPVHVYRVAFEPGARTNWHIHSGSQWLFVIEGRIRAQAAGQPAIELEAGDAMVIAPGERHWHGATPDARGVHLAVNVNSTTEWFEPVSENSYLSFTK